MKRDFDGMSLAITLITVMLILLFFPNVLVYPIISKILVFIFGIFGIFGLIIELGRMWQEKNLTGFDSIAVGATLLFLCCCIFKISLSNKVGLLILRVVMLLIGIFGMFGTMKGLFQTMDGILNREKSEAFEKRIKLVISLIGGLSSIFSILTATHVI